MRHGANMLYVVWSSMQKQYQFMTIIPQYWEIYPGFMAHIGVNPMKDMQHDGFQYQHGEFSQQIWRRNLCQHLMRDLGCVYIISKDCLMMFYSLQYCPMTLLPWKSPIGAHSFYH